MNFDKFKKVLPQKAHIECDDTKYLQHLNSLSEPRESHLLRIVGTVAAAVAIVAVVSLWALIGRGLRGSGEPIVAPPATEGIQINPDSYKEYELTGETLYKFESELYDKLRFTSIPLFQEGLPPTEQQIANYYYIARSGMTLRNFAKQYFKVESGFENIEEPSDDQTLDVIDAEYNILSITEATDADGKRIMYIFYSMEGYGYTLTYAVSGNEEVEVDYFISHTKDGAVPKAEPTVESEFQSIAKKYHFDWMYDFERGTLPEFSLAKHYIAVYNFQTLNRELNIYKGKNDWQVHGYPVDVYKQLMTEIFGGYELPDSITPITDITGPKYYGIDLVETEDGTIIVPIEIGGGDAYYYELNSYTEGKYNGQKTITVNYDLCLSPNYINPDKTTYAVTYTTTDGVHPDKFIEKLEVSDTPTQTHYPNNMTD